MSAASATGPRWRPRRAWSRSTSSMPRAACWWRPMAASSAASRPRPTAWACRGRARIRWCSTSPPRSWPRARCWWRARAARRCRTARWSAPTASPSSDPHLLYGDYTPTGPRDHSKGTGAIQAFGDHKGSGLAFMCEMLGGSLSGNGATDPKRGRFANGMLSFYVDPKVLDPAGFFPQDIARYVDFVKSSQARRGRRRDPGAGRARGAHARQAAGRGRAAARRHLGRHRRDGALGRARRATHPAGDDVALGARHSSGASYAERGPLARS